MELHHHNYPSDSSDSSDRRAKAKPKAKSKPKAKPFARDQAASGGNRPTQTAGSSAEAGSTAEAAPGQEPEPEEADNPLRDPFANMTPEELADFQRAEERYFGVDRLGEESEHSESGHS